MEIGLHYYQFNIGDYRRDTIHLSLVEHGIYRQLIDSYYLNEGPLTKSEDELMRSLCVRNADEQEAFRRVVKEFFVNIDGALIHRGCDKVIDQFHRKSDSARASAKARWTKEDANAMRTQCDGNATHNPIPITHKPIKDDKRVRALNCPPEVSPQVWDDFIAVRKANRSPLTETALRGIEREAQKAGWTLEQALAECAARGWRGFKAEWVRENKTLRDALDKTRMQNLELVNKTMRNLRNAQSSANGTTLGQIEHSLRGSVESEMGSLGPVYGDE